MRVRGLLALPRSVYLPAVCGLEPAARRAPNYCSLPSIGIEPRHGNCTRGGAASVEVPQTDGEDVEVRSEIIEKASE